jgi:hypothetical protein
MNIPKKDSVESVAIALFCRDHRGSSWQNATPVTKNAYRDEARRLLAAE